MLIKTRKKLGTWTKASHTQTWPNARELFSKRLSLSSVFCLVCLINVYNVGKYSLKNTHFCSITFQAVVMMHECLCPSSRINNCYHRCFDIEDDQSTPILFCASVQKHIPEKPRQTFYFRSSWGICEKKKKKKNGSLLYVGTSRSNHHPRNHIFLFARIILT